MLQIYFSKHLLPDVYSRSSRAEISVKKMLLEISCNFIKKETLAHVFSCEFCDISKNVFCYRTHPVAASSIQNPVEHLK